MNDEEVVERVCRLPVDFESGFKSMTQLVADSGIRRCLALLTVGHLLPYLAAHPELCDAWLRGSANQRVTSGWYFRRDADHFVVGFYPRGEVLTFAEPVAACAEFVVREVEALATRR